MSDWRDTYDAWKLATPPEYDMTSDEERALEDAQEIERLQAENDRLLAALDMEKAARRKLTELLDAQMGTPCEQIRHRAALDEAREALEPFATFPAASDGRLPPGMPMTQGSKFAAKQVIVADFWRARAALARIDAIREGAE